MTTIPDEIVEAALAAYHGPSPNGWRKVRKEMMRSALTAALPMLVRAEREACAQLAEDKFQYATEASGVSEYLTGVAIAIAIRARGER